MSLEIRPVGQADKATWLVLFLAYIEFYESSLAAEQCELTWERLNSDYNINGLVAVLDGKVVGIAHYIFRPCTWAVNDYCYLEDLFTDPEVRGQGVGRALINRLKEIATEKGSKRLYWNTKEGNATARRLYDSFVPASDFVQYRIPLD